MYATIENLVFLSFSCLDTIYSVNRSEGVTPERNAIGYTHVRLKRTCMGFNGILECKFLPENAHSTSVWIVTF